MVFMLFLQSKVVILGNTVDVAQLVRASVCGTEGRGFEPHLLPLKKGMSYVHSLFVFSL